MEKIASYFLEVFRGKRMPQWKSQLMFPGFHLPLTFVHFMFCKQPDIANTSNKYIDRLFKIYYCYYNVSVL